MSKEGGSKNGSGNYNIVLNSSNLFVCTLLKAVVEKNLDCYCTCHTTPPFFCLSSETELNPTLFMFDCFGYETDSLLQFLQPAITSLNCRHQISLFNLAPTSRIEAQALKLGVRGFFYENDNINTLNRGVRAILDNEIWVSRKIILECIRDNEHKSSLPTESNGRLPADLTMREAEILSILASGQTNALIANQLCLSPHTVRTHIYNIFRKIGVGNRCQAGRWAADNLNVHY